jgi:type VI secretion system protein VasG
LLANQARLTAGAYVRELSQIRVDELQRELLDIVTGSTEDVTLGGPETVPAGERVPRDDTALGRFCIDFTERARAGEIDPVFCRDQEIRQMIDILARRRKNNPIAVGEPGVGKTAVVEGLALKVVEGDVPDILKNVDILGLDMGLLQAGAGVKGEFENRLKSVINEVKESTKPIVLFIDEAHTLIGAGGSAGGSDAANLLKPALARGELRTIAATTWSEYKKYFEKDAALARRFQLVKLEEPTDEESVIILRGLRDKYEEAHKVNVLDDAIVTAAKMASRYISGRQQPDKGVDLLDTSAARVKIALTTKPDSLDDLERHIQTLERELHAYKKDEAAGGDVDQERITEIESEINETKGQAKSLEERWLKEKEAVERVLALQKQIEGGDAAASDEQPRAKDMEGMKKELESALHALKEIQGKNPLIRMQVDADVIAKVVSDWTGIPIGNMVQDEAQAILSMEDELRKRIKGQDQALDIVSKGVRAAKAGLKNPNNPMGVFLFVGPSGVGKTECGLAVADLLFGGDRFITTINMSEFQEKHTVSRLIGSPPGYVGYGEGGKLTEAVRQRPYSVVLLDEVEKADPEVMNLFYQVFDKGMLADGEGRNIDFKNTVIFMTSNLASDVIMEMSSDGEKADLKTLTGAIRPILSNHFKPALLARMTIVPFYPLAKDAMKAIVELKLDQLGTRLKKSHRMAYAYDPKVVEQIAQRCTEVETGARNIDHIMTGTLLPRISTEILQKMSEGALPDQLHLGLTEDGEFKFEFSSKS